MLRNLQNKIDGIVKSQQFISAKYDEMKSGQGKIQFISAKYDEMKSGQGKIEKQLKKFDETIIRLISQDKVKEAKFEELSEGIAELEKRDSETKIEIHGLEEFAEDNLGETVVKLIEKLDVNVDRSEIDVVERMKSKQTGKPRPIVVRFKSVRACNAVKAKKRAVLTNQDITRVRFTKRVIIYEHLSSDKKLLWQTKEKAREVGWKYVWSQNGQILIRKDDGSRIFQVECGDSLNTILK
ncbi:Baculovirus FP protein [Popillia japonica]|uniref:Baculovirus FP protein n=1 Tax=Popillia japonica TaxID=7064 RepID=A0AAW1I7T1_POPJA